MDVASLVLALVFGGAMFVLAGYTATFLGKKIAQLNEIKEEEAVDRPKERPAILDTIGRPFKGKVPKVMEEKANAWIQYAGHPYDMHPEDICGLMVVAAFIGLWGGIVFMNLLDFNVLYGGIPGMLLASGLPWLWLHEQVKKRHDRIIRDLPFNIDLLTLAVEAGLDFAAGVAKMVEKGKAGPVRDEFKIMLSEMRMGKARAEAMQEMANRVGLSSFTSFLSTLIQADRLGTGLGKVLRIQAEQMRMERSQRAEKKGAEAPVKMLMPLVLFIFPTIWCILAGPIIYQILFNF